LILCLILCTPSLHDALPIFFAWTTGSTPLLIAPFEGEERLISAITFIWALSLNDCAMLNADFFTGALSKDCFFSSATSFSFWRIILSKIVIYITPLGIFLLYAFSRLSFSSAAPLTMLSLAMSTPAFI